MEGEPLPDAPDAADARISPTLQLQTTTVSEFPALSLSPSFKLDEGYSDDTRSQADKDLGSDNVMALPSWLLAQSETGRAGKITLFPLPPVVIATSAKHQPLARHFAIILTN